MIKDLSIPTPLTDLWKYVDDVSISEFPTTNGGASIQSTLDNVSSLASIILMEFKAKKCKEPQTCFFFFFFKKPLSYPLHKLMAKYSKQFAFLGLVIQDNLYDCIQGIQASSYYACST